MSWRTPVTRGSHGWRSGTLRFRLGTGWLPQRRLLLSCRGAGVAGPVSAGPQLVLAFSWLLPPCDRNWSHGDLGEETPPSLGTGRGQSRGLAIASGALHPGDVTVGQPHQHRGVCTVPAAPGQLAASLRSREGPATHSLGAASACLSSCSCRTAALSKSNQCCSLLQEGQDRVSVLQTAGHRRPLTAVVRGLLPEWLRGVGSSNHWRPRGGSFTCCSPRPFALFPADSADTPGLTSRAWEAWLSSLSLHCAQQTSPRAPVRPADTQHAGLSSVGVSTWCPWPPAHHSRALTLK